MSIKHSDQINTICHYKIWQLTHRDRDKLAVFSRRHFQRHFLEWKWKIEFRLRFHWSLIPVDPINTIPVLVQVMASRRPGDKPLFEPMMLSLQTHIYVARPQWVKLAVILLWWLKESLWYSITTYLHSYQTILHQNGQCFPHCWPFVRKIHRSPVDSPYKETVLWIFNVS